MIFANNMNKGIDKINMEVSKAIFRARDLDKGGQIINIKWG